MEASLLIVIHSCVCYTDISVAHLTSASSSLLQKKRKTSFEHIWVIIYIAFDWVSLHSSGTDPGFPVGGGRRPTGGAPTYMILSKFPKKCMKSRKFWILREACARGGPLDPPLLFIGGSKWGASYARSPGGPNFIHFHAVFGKNVQNTHTFGVGASHNTLQEHQRNLTNATISSGF